MSTPTNLRIVAVQRRVPPDRYSSAGFPIRGDHVDDQGQRVERPLAITEDVIVEEEAGR